MPPRCLSAFLLAFLITPPLAAQEKKPKLSSSTVGALKLRAIGPALTGGRIAAFAVHPEKRSTYYAATASGGVWKTTNAGTTWTPIFDGEKSYSIGAITLDPKNPETVWVGTGENNSQRSVGYGHGVYRSDDGGKSWKRMGLDRSEHIGKILIDPRDSDVVWVAAQGPLWSSGGDRGLYKTTNGGKSWKLSLRLDENTGASDVTFHPSNPDVLLASAYQRRRRQWTLINGGPGSAIYKTTDGGENWRKVTRGLPSGDKGRIGLAFAPTDPSVAYALVEAAENQGGVFRSSDRGETWSKRNSFDEQGQYYGEIFVDPKDKDRIYIPNTYTMVSDDGGRTLNRLGEQWKHVDTHAFWVDPDDADHYLSGCDGGIYETFDRGRNWKHLDNLPLTQFYHITVDNNGPFYHVYGGTQDNFTLGGPAKTRSAHGITNDDWFVTQGGDGFHCKVDPENPDLVYCESQYGVLVRFNRKTGEKVGIQPMPEPGEPPLRWNWSSPLVLSPHSNTRLYFAAQRIFRSDDRGSTWKPISEDLTRDSDRDQLKIMGKLWSIDAVAKHLSTSPYGTIVSLVESPKQENLLFAGTDDGLMQITEDGGKTWRKIEEFPGVPEMSYVRQILPSSHDVNTLYVAFDNHKSGDFKGYLLKSADLGKTWESLVPEESPFRGPVMSIAEDHEMAKLLFVGTEFGLFFSNDGGKAWHALKSGLPTIQVADLAIQRQENDLAVGTFGRGIYILDDYSPLRHLNEELLAEAGAILPVRRGLMYIETRQYGVSGKGFRGASYFTADNPPDGVTFTYYLRDSLRTLKQKRKAEEKKKLDFPTNEELLAEADQEAPAVLLKITDAEGKLIRTLNGSTNAGLHRTTWNLRERAKVLPARRSESALFASGGSGILVTPGKYRVSLWKRVEGREEPLAEPVDFEVVHYREPGEPEVDHQARYDFQNKVADLTRAVTASANVANELTDKLDAMKRALDQTAEIEGKWRTKVREMIAKNRESVRALRGSSVLRSYHKVTSPSIQQRLRYGSSSGRLTLAGPTQTQQRSIEIAEEQFEKVLADLRQLAEEEVPALSKALEEAGAPWTPGRLPDWRR